MSSSVTFIADKLGLDFALIHRKRTNGQDVKVPEDRMELLVGDVKGKTVILVDDMIDTGLTVILATKLLKDAGATKIYVLASHGMPIILISSSSDDKRRTSPLISMVISSGIFADTKIGKLLSLPIEKLVVTNTVPQSENVKASESKLDILDVSPLLAESIRRTHNGESFNILFGEVGLSAD